MATPYDGEHMRRLIQECARQFGAPHFLVTDHGCQFRKRFKDAMARLIPSSIVKKHWSNGTERTGARRRRSKPNGISLVKGRQDPKRFNGKVERFFKTLKLWQRATLLACKLTSIQRRLDTYRDWYNTQRPMFILSGRTPQEAWVGAAVPKTAPILARDPQPTITVNRRRFRNDAHLCVLDIQFKKLA